MVEHRVFTACGPTYYEVKDRLFDQYVCPAFDDGTGLKTEELENGFNELARLDGSVSRMQLRSHLCT